MKRILAAAAAAALLSSCSGAAVEELIQPPRMNEQQSAIYDALKASVSGDINLKYPKSGQYRSAFVVKDLDSEATDEAFVFYEKPNISDGSSLRLNFLDRQGDGWVSVYDFAIAGSDVESVSFESFGGSGTYIIVSCLLPNSGDKAVSVLTLRDGTAEELYSGRCGIIHYADTDGDGNTELILVGTARGTDENSALILGVRGDEFGRIGEALLSDSTVISEYRNVVVGRYGEGSGSAIFADYIMSDGSYGTDVIICDGDKFIRSAYINPLTTERSTNTFTPVLLSRDADGDGITELPTTVPYPEYEEAQLPQKTNITIWNTISADGMLAEKMRAFTGTRGDYMLVMPDRWRGRVTVYVSFTEGSVTFFMWDSASRKTGAQLLKLWSASDENVPRFGDGGYIPLGRSEASGFSYFAEVSDGERLSVTEEELSELFVIFQGVKNEQ